MSCKCLLLHSHKKVHMLGHVMSYNRKMYYSVPVFRYNKEVYYSVL